MPTPVDTNIETNPPSALPDSINTQPNSDPRPTSPSRTTIHLNARQHNKGKGREQIGPSLPHQPPIRQIQIPPTRDLQGLVRGEQQRANHTDSSDDDSEVDDDEPLARRLQRGRGSSRQTDGNHYLDSLESPSTEGSERSYAQAGKSQRKATASSSSYAHPHVESQSSDESEEIVTSRPPVGRPKRQATASTSYTRAQVETPPKRLNTSLRDTLPEKESPHAIEEGLYEESDESEVSPKFLRLIEHVQRGIEHVQ